MSEVNAKKIKTRVTHKHASEQDWSQAVNFVPLAGELIIYDADANHSTPRVKFGDGKTNVNDLEFMGADLGGSVEEEVDKLIACGTEDPDSNSTSKFYFKYSE